MSRKTCLLTIACLAALAAPLAAQAQSWGDYHHDWDDRGDRGFHGYPQFAGETNHIQAEVRQGLAEGWLSGRQARGIQRQMQYVWYRETHEYREHGWALPPYDAQEIRALLDNIDRSVDAARDEGGYD
jgi:hypothetical protein